MSWDWDSASPAGLSGARGLASTPAGVFLVGLNASTFTKLWLAADGITFSLVTTDLPTSAFIVGPFRAIGSTLVMFDGGAFDGKFYYSNNAGANWTTAFLPGSPGSSVLQLVSDGTALYVADFDRKVWRSTNGSTWTQKTTIPSGIGGFNTFYGVNGLLFAGSQTGGKLAVSDDQGTTWTIVTPAGVSTTHTYAWFAYFGGEYHARLNKEATDSQYFTSADGETWDLQTMPSSWTDGGADDQLYHTSLAEAGSDVLLTLELPADDTYTEDGVIWASELPIGPELNAGLAMFNDIFYFFQGDGSGLYRGVFTSSAAPPPFWTSYVKTTET